jgi:DNA-binding SARP family transcriptional activator
VEFQVLGPLRVVRGTEPVHLGSAYKQRLVLALLLSRGGRGASVDWLVDAVWGARPPASARRNIHLYLHRLRGALGGDVVRADAGGYAVVAGDGLDVARWDGLVADGTRSLERGDFAAADRALGEALDLWRGPAYDGFGDCAPIGVEAGRLEESRLAARGYRAQAGLALGRHRHLVDELAGLVRAHPFRENLAAQLMLALYRCGRQADALTVYRDTRAVLRGQLGIEPGPELRDLHERMLRGDEALTATGRTRLERGTGPVPRQLPMDLPDFTGRTGDLDLLLEGSG